MSGYWCHNFCIFPIFILVPIKSILHRKAERTYFFYLNYIKLCLKCSKNIPLHLEENRNMLPPFANTQHDMARVRFTNLLLYHLSLITLPQIHQQSFISEWSHSLRITLCSFTTMLCLVVPLQLFRFLLKMSYLVISLIYQLSIQGAVE